MLTRRTDTAGKSVTKDRELKLLAQLSERELMMELRTSPQGLTEEDAARRLSKYGPNEVATQKPMPWQQLLWHSFQDPFVYVLLLLVIVSVLTKDFDGALVMGVMILASVTIRFVQDYRSQKASEALKDMIENTCAVIRDGNEREIPMDEVVPGDIVKLSTGDMIPADIVLTWTKDLFVNQSSLTGESLPVEKFVHPHKESVEIESSALDYESLAFMGTDVLSGQGQGIILKTGSETFFGDVAQNATKRRGGTSFDRGLQQISKLLLRLIIVLFPIVFILNGLTKGDWGQAFFFAIAVAVGLTPEMLPMIVTSNLARGSVRLAKKKVIVKELPAIQNLGSMDVLCTDKTGTITEDKVVLVKHVNFCGEDSREVLDLTYLNSSYQTGWKNLMDHAVLTYYKNSRSDDKFVQATKIDEIPFDFSRRRLTVVVKQGEHQLMITKGAVEEMEKVCTYVEIEDKKQALNDELRERLRQLSKEMNQQGMRVLAVARKDDAHSDATYTVDDEKDMTFVGFMGFLDPAKESAKPTIRSLLDHGVAIKVLTGDNETVARKVCQDVGIEVTESLAGTDVDQLTTEELSHKVETVNLFAKLSPLQKARLIQILQQNGHTVGFMGDGINDAPALREADVGISVDTAADITKDASSIILLQKSLDVLEDGIIEGRKVFSNMMKYIRITISSNFGNVFSILVASAFLPFLPMLSIQLLIQNLIYDCAQLTIPWDRVDQEDLHHPAVWNMHDLLRFTVVFGPVSSLFDVLLFAVMWLVFYANTVSAQGLFQSGWFLVGLATQTLVVHIIRTNKLPFIQSRASLPVILATLGAILTSIGIILWEPLRTSFNFSALPMDYWPWWFGIVLAYLLTAELAKRIYLHQINKKIKMKKL